MPIDKVDGSVLRKLETPYEVVQRDLVQSIKHPDALAIWIYLLTKPHNWIVRRQEVMDHFNIGRDRYQNAIKYLQAMGLVSYAEVRNEKGHLSGKVLWIHGHTTEEQVNRSSEKPDVRSNRPLKDTEIKNKDTEITLLIPEGVHADAWKLFDDHRNSTAKLRRSWSNQAKAIAAGKLSQLTVSNQLACVEYSILGGYPGLYPERFMEKSNGHKSSQQSNKPNSTTTALNNLKELYAEYCQ